MLGLLLLVCTIGSVNIYRTRMKAHVYSNPQQPLEQMGYQTILMFQAETGLYIFGKSDKGGMSVCYFMTELNDGWHIVEKLHPQILPFMEKTTYADIVGSYYKASSERQSVVVIGRRIEDSELLDNKKVLVDSSGSLLELYQTYDSLLNDTICTYIGLTCVDQEYSIIGIEP